MLKNGALTAYGGLLAWDHFLNAAERSPNWDSTVIPRYGKQEDTAIGYNPAKPGRPSHHPLACVIGGTRLCLHMEWRKGNTVSASGWTAAMEKVWRNPTAQHRIRLNRGDIGFDQGPGMARHGQEGRVIVERRLKPLNASPQGTIWKQCVEDFGAYVTNLTRQEK